MIFTHEFSLLSRLYVEFDYSPGRPGKMYLRNGDPGYPDEPAEVEVTEIRFEQRGIGVNALWTPLDFPFDWEIIDPWLQSKLWEVVQAAEDAALAEQAEAREYARELEDFNP